MRGIITLLLLAFAMPLTADPGTRTHFPEEVLTLEHYLSLMWQDLPRQLPQLYRRVGLRAVDPQRQNILDANGRRVGRLELVSEVTGETPHQMRKLAIKFLGPTGIVLFALESLTVAPRFEAQPTIADLKDGKFPFYFQTPEESRMDIIWTVMGRQGMRIKLTQLTGEKSRLVLLDLYGTDGSRFMQARQRTIPRKESFEYVLTDEGKGRDSLTLRGVYERMPGHFLGVQHYFKGENEVDLDQFQAAFGESLTSLASGVSGSIRSVLAVVPLGITSTR